MPIRRLLYLPVFLLLIAAAPSQQAERWAILPSREADAVNRSYLWGRVSGHWTPTSVDIGSLQANLEKISSLHAKSSTANRIEHPEQYFRQYIGIVISGEKRVFVNAICEVKDIPDWRERLVFVFDGGTCFWQAVFDPNTKTFSDLEINGKA